MAQLSGTLLDDGAVCVQLPFGFFLVISPRNCRNHMPEANSTLCAAGKRSDPNSCAVLSLLRKLAFLELAVAVVYEILLVGLTREPFLVQSPHPHRADCLLF